MKLKLFTLIIFGFCNMVAMNAMSYSDNAIPKRIETSDVPPNMTEIELHGTLAYNPGPNTVEAYYNSNMVVVCFHQNFGYVNIILIGGGNTIYNGNVNTALQQTVYIPIAGTPSGSYTLILNNA
ncbi:MAG: DUF3244 domain-containing protein [Bacteroidales bacterium]|nr:DUF3244 domain-containing protein [Bacteroidales bacterium]